MGLGRFEVKKKCKGEKERNKFATIHQKKKTREGRRAREKG